MHLLDMIGPSDIMERLALPLIGIAAGAIVLVLILVFKKK